MKYIISESRFSETVLNYLNRNYGNLNWSYYLDDDYNESDCAIVFYDGDYSDGDVKFRLYNKCWWDSENSENVTENFEKSPILTFENTGDYLTLEGYFGELWYDIFKNWFDETYGFEIKTIE